jgi:hypothetical protein
MRHFAVATTIAVQAFSKAERIIRTLNSIAESRGSNKYNLLILQDGCAGSQQTEKYREVHAKTTSAIESWTSTNRHAFQSVCFQRSHRNCGPYSTAQQLIDWAFETSESVIFSEDDIIFEKDALEWFERALAHPMFLRPQVWAVAGESKFFDASRHVPSAADICYALEVARAQRLIDRFVYFDFLPSSCFATIPDKWADFGKTRGAANGDWEVIRRCRAEGKLCLWPVVARCRDVGMHDPLGWSVRWRGADHSAFKNSYITSGMLEDGSRHLSELVAEKEALLNEFTRLWHGQTAQS